MTKLLDLNCDKTKKNGGKTKKIQIVKKLKLWQNSKNTIVTKGRNSICHKTQKLKLWKNSKNEIVTKIKKNLIVTKLKKIKLWQN